MKRPALPSLALLACSALIVGTAGLTPALATSGNGNGRTTLPGSVPAWANAAHRASATPSSTPLDFRVYLNWRGGDAAAAYATAASTPGNALHGKFLSPSAFNQRFAPTSATVSQVEGWLKASGFKVGHVPSNNKYVEATGTVAQAAAAFDTGFAEYNFDGATLRSNTEPLSIPATLGAVEGVIGLDESAALVQHYSNPPAVFNNARPCSSYWGEKTVQNTATLDGTTLPASPSAFSPCGYAGAQLQGVYGMSDAINSGNDGSGVTVAIVDAYASPTIASDVNTYSAAHGLPSVNGHFSQHVAPGTFVRGQNKAQDPEGWSGEETLDVEAVHTMAPGANILYVGSPNNYQDMDAALNWIVSKRAADVITNSYGFAGEALPRGYIKPQNDILIQAAAEGISVFFSSGDNADETNGVAGATPTPDWPASSPWVTAVGGTSLGIAQDNSRIFELGWATEKGTLNSQSTTWNPAFWLYGAGGGTSRLFAQPSYQAGVVPAAISQTYGGAAMRTVPDVSALADPTTGMAVGQTQTWPDGHTAYSEYRIGGTSLASPLYAGMFALAVQKAGHSFGLANPALYATAGSSYDVTKAQLADFPGAIRSDYVNGVDATGGYVYSARYFDRDANLTIHVRNGYDDITGVGSPNGQAWLNAVAAQ